MTIEDHHHTPIALLPARCVRSRYSVSGRTLSRWRRNPNLAFPHALMINGRCYFDEADLAEWERSRAATVEVSS